MKKGRNKGFTLFELLIVIAILAILYSIAAANVMGLQNEARISKARGDLKTLKLALDTYVKNYNMCPKKQDYQYVLIQESPNLLVSHLTDPFGPTANTLYPFDASNNSENYVVYSIGIHKDGAATIGDDGKVSLKGTPLFETNGYD